MIFKELIITLAIRLLRSFKNKKMKRIISKGLILAAALGCSGIVATAKPINHSTPVAVSDTTTKNTGSRPGRKRPTTPQKPITAPAPAAAVAPSTGKETETKPNTDNLEKYKVIKSKHKPANKVTDTIKKN